MIAVASTVVHFFKDEQHTVSKFNLLYVVYRAGQITVSRLMPQKFATVPGPQNFVMDRDESESYLEDFLAVFTRPTDVQYDG